MLKCFTISVLFLMSSNGWAVVEPKFKQLQTTSSLLSQTTHRKLKRVQNLFDKKALDEALAELNKLEKKLAGRKGDVAKINQYKGFVFAEKGNYQASLNSFSKAVNSGGLDRNTAIQSLQIMGQLNMSLESYKKAAELFESVKLHNKNIPANTLASLAVSYAHLKSHDAALKNITAAISSASKPNRNWLELKVALHQEKSQYKQAIRSLNQLIEMNPKEIKYWRQLASMSLFTGSEVQALAALKSIEDLNIKTQKNDVLQRVQLQLSKGEPYYAARSINEAIESGRLEKNLKNYQILAQAWTAAKEYSLAIAAYEKAGKFDKSGKTDLLRGQLLVEEESWTASEAALKLAVKKLKSDEKIAKAQLLLGIVKIQRKHFESAKASFAQAMKVKKYLPQAQAWLAYLK